jgi:antitoxin HicB
MTQNLFIILEEEKRGGFSASVPALPGCFSQGNSFDEALKNAKEAIMLYLQNEKITKASFPKNEVIVPVQIGLK